MYKESTERRENTCLQVFRPGLTKKRAVRPQNVLRDLKFRVYEVEELYNLCREKPMVLISCAGYLTADLLLYCAYAKSRFSHDASLLHVFTLVPKWYKNSFL